MSWTSRSTRNSQRHLSSDCEWETLPSINENTSFSNAFWESSRTVIARKDRRDRKFTSTKSDVVSEKTDYKRNSFDSVSKTFHRTSRNRNTAPSTRPEARCESIPLTDHSSASKRNSKAWDKETRIAAPAHPATWQPNCRAKFHRDDSRQITRSHVRTSLHKMSHRYIVNYLCLSFARGIYHSMGDCHRMAAICTKNINR